MNFTLTRGRFALYGILGQIKSEDESLLLCTLEHSYLQSDGSFLPKLCPGTYTFKRRFSPKRGYDVFTLENAPAFMGSPVTFIEIHKGNYNNDSEGCILLGMKFGTGMIYDSQIAFDSFMEKQQGVDEFELTVVAP